MKIPDLIHSRFNPLPSIIPFKLLIHFSGFKILCIFYHTVSDYPPDHIKNLYRSKSLKEFTDDMRFLVRHYKPIDLFKLREIVYNGGQDENYLFVSFDDGLKEFYSNAVPILYRMGIPSTCFLNNAFIDNKDMFYRYKISILIEELNRNSQNSLFMQQVEGFKKEYNLSGKNRDVLLKMKYSDTKLINEFAKLLRIDFNSYLYDKKPYMTSDQISELINQGFTFGAHSFDHPEFAEISDNEKVHQSLESINNISDRFRLPYKVFSFPFTDKGVSSELFDLLSNNNIDLTFGTSGLEINKKNHHVQRIPMEGYFRSAELRIRNFYFFSMLK